MTMFGLFGAPFGIFIASLIMDKIPRRVMGVILLAGMAGLGVATGLLAPTLGMTGLIVMTFFLTQSSICMFATHQQFMFLRCGLHRQNFQVRASVTQWVV